MRSRSLLVLVFSLFLTTAAFGQRPANELEGSWLLISQMAIYPDSTVDRTDQIPRTLKILNSTHFAFGRQIGDEDVYAGGGSYTFDGKSYTEHIDYHSAAGLAGQAITFQARIDENLWYHTGDLGDFVLEEIWERVD